MTEQERKRKQMLAEQQEAQRKALELEARRMELEQQVSVRVGLPLTCPLPCLPWLRMIRTNRRTNTHSCAHKHAHNGVQ